MAAGICNGVRLRRANTNPLIKVSTYSDSLFIHVSVCLLAIQHNNRFEPDCFEVNFVDLERAWARTVVLCCVVLGKSVEKQAKATVCFLNVLPTVRRVSS